MVAEEIRKDGVLYAIILRAAGWQKGLNFITPDEMFLQVGTFWYQEDNKCKPHRHIENERPNNLTQECNIVLSGLLEVNLYDENNRLFRTEVLSSGDFIVMVNGAHGFKIRQPDTKIIECKNGPYITVEKDKVLI